VATSADLPGVSCPQMRARLEDGGINSNGRRMVVWLDSIALPIELC
jgi:hypothetical protein